MRSLLSLLSYLDSGQNRERYLGVTIPPTNLQEHQLEQAGGGSPMHWRMGFPKRRPRQSRMTQNE